MSMTQSTPMVCVERESAVVRVVLDRPPLNVLDLALLHDLRSTLTELAADQSVKALIVTGHGSAFCAGVDVADHTPERVPLMLAAFHSVLLRLLEFPSPVIAMVNGAALGGGFELLMACDVVIARHGAKLGLPEIRLGAFPPFAAVVLPRLIGRQNSLDLVLTGRTILAEEAFSIGLVQHMASAEKLGAYTKEYAQQLVGSSGSVLRLAKRAILEGLRDEVMHGLAACEALYRDELMRLADAREGIAAFLEKREPVWEESLHDQ